MTIDDTSREENPTTTPLLPSPLAGLTTDELTRDIRSQVDNMRGAVFVRTNYKSHEQSFNDALTELCRRLRAAEARKKYDDALFAYTKAYKAQWRAGSNPAVKVLRAEHDAARERLAERLFEWASRLRSGQSR